MTTTQPYDDLEEIIEIRDPEINVAEIMAQIRANLAKRPPLEIDLDALRYQPGQITADISLDERLQYHLRQAIEQRDQIFVGDQLRPPGPSIVARALQPLRRQLHQLVRFYVDLAAARQAVVNTHLTEVIAALLEKSRADEARIAELEARIRELTATPSRDA